MRHKLIFLISFVFLLSGCNFASDFAKTQRMLVTSSFGNNEVMIYGNYNHDIYLGNINPSKQSRDSVWNESSKYGNKFSVVSIRNRNGKYGSPTSPFSACSRTATHPPILKDKYNFNMGYFSLNPNIKRRVGQTFLNILKGICNK